MKRCHLHPGFVFMLALLPWATAQAATHDELHAQYLSIVGDGSASESELREALDYEEQAFTLSPQFKYAYNVGIVYETLDEYAVSAEWFDKALGLAEDADQTRNAATALNYSRTQLARLNTGDWNLSITISMVLKGGSMELDRLNFEALPPALAPYQPGEPLTRMLDPIRPLLPETEYEVLERPPFLLVAQRNMGPAEEQYRKGIVDFYNWYRQRYFDEPMTRPLTVLFIADPYSGQALIRDIYPTGGAIGFQPFLGVYNPKDNLIVATVPTGYGTFLHELMHAMVRTDFDAVPRWLDEGMAMLYERSLWRNGRLVPLPNWRLDGISRADELELAVFREMDAADTYDYRQLSALRMLMLYLESANRLKSFYEAVKDTPELRSIGAALESLSIKSDDWDAFVEESLRSYTADKARGGRQPTNPDEVKFIQMGLNRVLGTGYAVDGHWGPDTEGQVRRFQEQAGITVDGVAGPETMKRLKMALAALDAAQQ